MINEFCQNVAMSFINAVCISSKYVLIMNKLQIQ